MAELRAKRLTNAREDGQDRYHEARHARRRLPRDEKWG
jgi:hypothetical protein